MVSRVPKGRVATYGQVAMLAGLPRQARFVGYALHALPTDSDVPWHRVVNAAGRISLRADALGHDELQAQLLRREGVRFVNGTIPLGQYLWNPKRVPEPSRDGTRRAKLAGSPRDHRWQPRSRR